MDIYVYFIILRKDVEKLMFIFFGSWFDMLLNYWCKWIFELILIIFFEDLNVMR